MEVLEVSINYIESDVITPSMSISLHWTISSFQQTVDSEPVCGNVSIWVDVLSGTEIGVEISCSVRNVCYHC